jgi:hypothetical protein
MKPRNESTKPTPDPHALGLRLQFKDGQDWELRHAIEALRRADGIGSGQEAAAFLERLEHRR